jgi:hypothetical protein
MGAGSMRVIERHWNHFIKPTLTLTHLTPNSNPIVLVLYTAQLGPPSFVPFI